MVELQSHAALTQDADDAEPANSNIKKGKKACRHRWGRGRVKDVHPVLFLDPAWVIALANAPDRELCRLKAARAEPAHKDFTALYDDEDGKDGSATGAIFAWGRSGEVTSIGILYLVLAFFLVEGRVIRDRTSPLPPFFLSETS